MVSLRQGSASCAKNGPTNGTINAWGIDSGDAISDSFTVSPLYHSSIEDLSFVYWENTGNLLTTVDMSIGSTSFGGTPQTLTANTNTLLFTNEYGFGVYQADFTFANIDWSGAGWLTLQNACTTAGCQLSGGDTIYWDENDGPSLAWDRLSDTQIGSESFTLTGVAPEPSSLILFGSGILGLAGILRKKIIG
jgi:hypothetical protein